MLMLYGVVARHDVMGVIDDVVAEGRDGVYVAL